MGGKRKEGDQRVGEDKEKRPSPSQGKKNQGKGTLS